MAQTRSDACSIQSDARDSGTPVSSATRLADASARSENVETPPSMSRRANTGPIPLTSVRSSGCAGRGGSLAGVTTRKLGGSGSLGAAIETNRSRMAHATAATPPRTPNKRAIRFMREMVTASQKGASRLILTAIVSLGP